MDTFRIDPLTGRPLVRGPGGYAPGEDFMAPRGPTIADRMREMAATQQRGVEAAQTAAPASPRQFMGPGDGAPMFDPNPPPLPSVGPQVQPTAPPMDAPDVGAFNQPPTVGPQGVLTNAGAETPVPMQPNDNQPLPLPPPSPPRAPPVAPPVAAPQAGSGGALMAPTLRPPASADDIDAFAARIAPAESGGRIDVVNGGGYVGLFQFGAPRLQTLGVYTPGPNEQMQGWGGRGGGAPSPNQWTGTFNIPGFSEVRTLEDFRRNEAAQRAVFRGHVQDIDQTIDSTPGADAFDRNGLRAAAHIGGNGGIQSVVAGGPGAVDVNGQGPASYYRRFTGSDAPPGAAGMTGGGANSAPGSFRNTGGTVDAAKPPPAEAPSQGFLAGSPGAMGSPNVAGIPASALMAWGSGMLGGRNFQDGMARGGEAFTGQMNREQAMVQQRENNANARADRNQARRDGLEDRRISRQDTNARHAETIRVAEQRAALGRGGNGENVQSRDTYIDPQTQQAYVRVQLRGGQSRLETLDGRAVTDEAVANRIVPQAANPQGSVDRANARADAEYSTSVFDGRSAATEANRAIANVRQVLARSPNLTGASLRQQAGRAVAQAMGMTVDGKSPDDIDAMLRSLSGLEMEALRQAAPVFKPMSNADVPTILRSIPGAMTSSRNLEAFLGEMETRNNRAISRADEFSRVVADPEQAARYRGNGGLRRWGTEWDQRNPWRGPTIQPNNQTGGYSAAPTAAQQRTVGETYQTNSGPMIWRGQGWERPTQ